MWPTEYVELQRIDELLICRICYEYMDTSVVTSCSHNYCSLCIRRYLHYKTQCPTCSEETFEKDLRKNKILDDFITYYLNVKEKLEKELHKGSTQIIKNDKLESLCSSSKLGVEEVIEVVGVQNSESPVRTVGNCTPRAQRQDHQDVSSPSTSTEAKIPSMFTPKSRKLFRTEENCKMVPCPVCKVDVSQNNINKHLDDCLKRETTNEQPKKAVPKRKPLPKLVLSLMKDSVLRKKMKELGLSSQGDRKTLENRLHKYIILYNAECDKINPRPVAELIKQYEDEENVEKKIQKASNRLNINRYAERNVIEEERKKYLAANKDSFEQLITKIKGTTPRKLSVKRDILRSKNTDGVIESCSNIKESEESNFLPINAMNSYIEDSDSNISCPLQTYSSENPMNFLKVEKPSSSNDNNVHSNYDMTNSSCKMNPISPNSFIEVQNVRTSALSSESILIKTEVVSNDWPNNRENDYQIRECNVSADMMDDDIKESFFFSELHKNELETNQKSRLSIKRDRNGTKFTEERHVADSQFRNRQVRRKQCNKTTQLSLEGIEHNITLSNNTDGQFNYGRLEDEPLCNRKEESTSGCTKFEKENVESLNESINVCAFRKRDCDITLNDEETIEDRSINARKLPRLGLTEVKGYNNENFSDDGLQNEDKSQDEREQMYKYATKRLKTVSNPRKSLRLKSKASKVKKNAS